MQVLDEVLPQWEFRSAHSVWVAAPPERVRDELLALSPRDLRLTRVLMGVRSLPRRLRGSPRNGDRRSNGAALLPGSVELVRREFELALGLAGQFWKPVPVIVPLVDGRAFRAFSRPGCGKAAIGFEIAAEGGGSRLSTETRVVTTDAATRRTFARYWLVVRTGSGLIRREMLRELKRRAERPSGPGPRGTP